MMKTRVHFSGPARYRLRSATTLYQSVLGVTLRRLLKGPQQPGWNWFAELGTQVLKRQLAVAFTMHDVSEARRYLDSLVVSSPAPEVKMTEVVLGHFRGSWFKGKSEEARVTLLYLHGGGYSFYPRAYAHFIGLITLAAKSKTFALDYRLSPEYRFPAQLEDALNAYRWLLGNGTNPEHLVLAGDSAGGNLTLALLLAARDANLPLPALAITLSPATDFDIEHAGIVKNQCFDWIDKDMLEQWRDWFCDSAQRRNPLISPVWADLRGLPPIYIQAGRREILYDSIQAFADLARKQGADVVFEPWEDMIHDFQLLGPDVPQSAEALRRLGEVIEGCTRERKSTHAVSRTGW
jgi:epsilon-lactone hydrolase